jgi:hypothetical protein
MGEIIVALEAGLRSDVLVRCRAPDCERDDQRDQGCESPELSPPATAELDSNHDFDLNVWW